MTLRYNMHGEIVDEYLLFFIIIATVFIVPNLLRKFNVPAITSIMLAGILIGPYGLNILQIDETLKIFSSFGAIFLMFLAGLEVDNETLRKEFKNSMVVSLFSLLIPGVGGYLVGQYLGLGFAGSLLYSVIFASHSVGIVYALMDELKMVKTKLGTMMLSATILIDLITLILLSIVIKLGETNAITSDIWMFLISTALYIGGLLLAIPYLSRIIFKNFEKLHIQRIHFVLFIILISVLIGEFLGLHPIVGAFITGVAVSEALTKEEHDELLNKNLNAIGYGFFIPIFFLVLGMETNVKVIFNLNNLELVLITIVSAILLKLTSGLISLRILGYRGLKCFVGSLLTVPKISASLVAASVGRELGIISDDVFVAIVALSIVTAMITPIGVKNIVVKHLDRFLGDD